MSPQFSGSERPNAVRMLVLETDETHPDTHEEHGSFGQIFDDLFKKAGDNHDPPLGVETVMRFVVESEGGSVPHLDDLEDVHAILITGSMYDAHGDDGWILKLISLIQDLWVKRPDMRFSGVCFGHQILCRALGSEVKSSPGNEWELAHTGIKLTELGKKIFSTEDSSLHLHQMHQDHVVNVPSSKTTDLLRSDQEIHIWGHSDHTEVQGVYLRDRLFTTQGHLGLNEAMVKRQIDMRIKSGSIKEEDNPDAAKELADMEHDGEIVAAAILRLFHGDDSDLS